MAVHEQADLHHARLYDRLFPRIQTRVFLHLRPNRNGRGCDGRRKPSCYRCEPTPLACRLRQPASERYGSHRGGSFGLRTTWQLLPDSRLVAPSGHAQDHGHRYHLHLHPGVARRLVDAALEAAYPKHHGRDLHDPDGAATHSLWLPVAHVLGTQHACGRVVRSDRVPPRLQLAGDRYRGGWS